MAAAFDFKKEYKDLYLPRALPMLIDVPTMTFVAVAGSGNPNEDNGDYAEALGLLYAFSFTVKMAKMGDCSRTATSTTSCRRSKGCGGEAGSTGRASRTRTRSTGCR